MNEVMAWIVFPLIALAICMGIGLLSERIARVELEPSLVAPLGFSAAIVLLGPLFALGAGEVPGLILLVIAALAGFAGRARSLLTRFRPGFGAAAGLATYWLHIAPVAMSGTAAFLGYNLLNDTAIHLALVDWIGDHGTTWTQLPPSSYAAAIDEYVGNSYPLGSHELLAALRPATGLDPALIYQGFLAFAAALGAAAVNSLLRGERVGRVAAALAAFAALGSQLVFSFSLQGGIKEITFITCLVTAAALGAGVARSDRPAAAAGLLALPAAALYLIYGVYALPWIAPLALLALWLLVRERLRLRPPLFAGVGVFLLAIAVDVKGSIDYYQHGHKVITGDVELGPLAGPLEFVQSMGIWLQGDYRFDPANRAWLTYVLGFTALLLAIAGIVVIVRRRRAGPLVLVATAVVAWAVVSAVSSPYIDAKALVVLSPALVLAACVALFALPRPIAITAAVVLGGALLVSDGLAYRVALIAPMDRLDELATIDKRFAGKGPVLVNEFEEYTKHFMRRSRGSDPYEGWSAGRAQLIDTRLPVGGESWDLDQLRPEFVQRYALIATRRSPVASRPPSNYDRVYSGRFYEVWERHGPAPLRHFPLGNPPLSASDEAPCSVVRQLAQQGDLIGYATARPTTTNITKGPLPPGWYRVPADPLTLDVGKGGEVATKVTDPIVQSVFARTPVRHWIRGSTFRKSRLVVDGMSLAIPRQLNGPNQWIEIGTTQARRTVQPTVVVQRPKRSLRPGDGRHDEIGPVVSVAEIEPIAMRVPSRNYRRLCKSFALDWIDVVKRKPSGSGDRA
jgi:hypothetical protein